MTASTSDDYKWAFDLLAGHRPDDPFGRQCSIGWHNECSDPNGHSCECPCHKTTA